MKGISRVLCAVDLSDVAEIAVERAIALAHQEHGELIVLNAVSPDLPPPRRVPERMAHLTTLARRAEGSGVRVRTTLEAAEPVEAILAAVQSFKVDVVVLGTHGVGRFARWRTNSVVEQVVQRAPCPTLVVPRFAAGRRAAGAFPEHVLCAVSFSPSSINALEHAGRLARGASSRLTAVHVLEDLAPRDSFFSMHFEVPEYRHVRARDAWRRLQVALASAARGPVSHARVVSGVPSQEIVRVAHEVDADVMVLGSGEGGRHALENVVGPTTTRVMRGATRPVLVVPPSARLDRSIEVEPEHEQLAMA